MYAIVYRNKIVDYPVNIYELNPNTMFPQNWEGGKLDGKQYVKVQYRNPYDIFQPKIGWGYREDTPVNIDGVWTQNFVQFLVDKDNIKLAVSGKRKEVQNGGFVYSGTKFPSTTADQVTYANLDIIAQANNPATYTINWKTLDNTYIELDGYQIKNINVKCNEHIQACFNKEKEYYDMIDTLTEAELQNVDFGAGWPSNG